MKTSRPAIGHSQVSGAASRQRVVVLTGTAAIDRETNES